MRRPSRLLTNEELFSVAFLCGSVALLIAIAVFLGTAPATPDTDSLAAATALGDAQGAPPGYTGQQYPDYTSCWINYMYSQYGWDGSRGPLCRNNSAQPFYSGIFSINPTGSTAGESVYVNSSWIDAGFVQGPLLGPPFSMLGCPDGATMSVTEYDEFGNPTSGECYYSGSGPTINDPRGGGTPAGPATYCYTDIPAGRSGPSSSKYSFPAGYSVTTGDKLDTVGGSNAPGSAFDRINGGGDGQCHAWKWMPAHMNSTLSPVGTIPAVATDGELTLQWSCQPSRVVNGWGCHPSGSSWSHPFGVSCSESQYTNNVLSISPVATGASGSGQNFVSGSSLGDTKTITAPSTKGIYNYSLTCSGPYNLPTMTIPVDVGGAAVYPTVTITGNGHTGTVAADVGTTTVNVVSTFVPGEGDTLTRTALNGCIVPNTANPDQNCQNSVPGTNNTDAVTPKSYSFKPTQPGLYYFYPALKTQLYFGWNDYGKKLIVNAQCAAGFHWATGSGAYGNSDWGPNKLGTSGCVRDPAPCPGGQNNPPACTTCSPFYHLNNSNVCVPNTCTDPHAVAPQCTACESGYAMQNGSCVPIPPELSLTVAQARVRSGTPASLSWNVGGLSGEPTVQCAITSLPQGVFSRVMPTGTKPTWSGSNVATGNITGTTVFTLSCTGAGSVSKTVTVIPTYIEQ